jgi:hypothetical protein
VESNRPRYMGVDCSRVHNTRLFVLGLTMALTDTELAIILVLWLIGWIIAHQLGRAITFLYELGVRLKQSWNHSQDSIGEVPRTDKRSVGRTL